MKKKIAIGITVGLILATMGRVAYAGSLDELGEILQAGTDGLKLYFDFLLDVLKVIW